MPNSSSARSPLHLAALQWVELGFPVFPILPDDKRPATPNGLYAATLDPAQIDAWWTENPNYNIGWSPASSGMAVLDTDPPLGETTLEQIVAQEGAGSWPQTYTVLTPRGGHHFYFIGDVQSTVQKLGPKLDTRGQGGYVLLPPSLVNGKTYTVIDDRDMAQLPGWVTRRIAAQEQKHVSGTDELDDPRNIARAKSALGARISAGDIAVEGSGGDARTLQQAYELRDLGVSADRAFDLMRGDWNAACIPPWDEDELRTKITNAYAYAQNEAGAYAVKPVGETFAEYLKTIPREKHPRFYVYNEDEQDDWPEPTWMLPEVLPDESTVLMYGPSRSYKSFLALDMALGFAYGKETFGFTPTEAIETLYVAGEAPRGISRQRRPAWKIAREAEGNGKFSVVKDMPTLLNGGIDALIAQIKEQGKSPKLILIDTLAKAMAGLNENDARDAGLFIAGVERMRDEFKATVVVVHHVGKDADRGARGSSAFFSGFDAALEVKANNKTKTVQVAIRKMKDADEREQPFMFEGKQIGPGLVFFPMQAKDFDALNAEDDPLAPTKVGAVLRDLRATTIENAVTTPVMASALFPAVEGQGAAERAVMLNKEARKLSKMAGDRLAGYTTGSGHDLRWYIPT